MAAIGALPWSATVTLTNAQIISLPTVPITIVSAPGVGKVIIPTLVVYRKSFAAASYSNTTGFCALYLSYEDNGFATTLIEGSPFGAQNTKIFTAITNVAVPDQSGAFAGFLGVGDEIPTNSALRVTAATDNAQNFGGGNSANSLTVTVYYVMEG